MDKVIEKLVNTGRPLESFSYVQVPIWCKKVECRSCPHGPYWYARYRAGRKVKAIYIGRSLPEILKQYLTTTISD
mgnify:CR=1 FL=1